MSSMAGDRIDHPPERREFVSPDGKLQLVIEAVDGWKRLAARASLSRRQGGPPLPLWSQPIPQQLGPREVLVTDEGRVLMLDEGINVRSRYALMLFDPQGKVVATHDFDALMRTAQASNADIRANALRGTWMGPPAALALGGTMALVPFAGRTLRVSLVDGQLTRAR